MQGSFESYAPASAELTLLRRGGSIVTLGNMITLPVGGGLLYIEPVYVTAAAAGATGSYPSLQRVFVYYGGRQNPVGFQPTLSAALAQVFTGAQNPGVTSPGTKAGGAVSGQVRADLKLAQRYYTQAQAALKAGDLAAYAKDINKMEQEITSAQQAANASAAPSKPASPGPSPSPSPSR